MLGFRGRSCGCVVFTPVRMHLQSPYRSRGPPPPFHEQRRSNASAAAAGAPAAGGSGGLGAGAYGSMTSEQMYVQQNVEQALQALEENLQTDEGRRLIAENMATKNLPVRARVATSPSSCSWTLCTRSVRDILCIIDFVAERGGCQTGAHPGRATANRGCGATKVRVRTHATIRLKHNATTCTTQRGSALTLRR